jgi:hypothetical protein
MARCVDSRTSAPKEFQNMTKRKYDTAAETAEAHRRNGLNAVAKKKGIHASPDVAALGGASTFRLRRVGAKPSRIGLRGRWTLGVIDDFMF